MDDLRVSLVQGDTRWHDPEGNRAYYGSLLDGLQGRSDLIVLPETFTSGFSNQAIHQAEDMEGLTLRWMSATARKMDAAIVGSVQLHADGDQGEGVYNRLLFVDPEGHVEHYDKHHLFRYANEHERYKAGNRHVIVSWRGWKLMLQVCYDLRFPVWTRNTTHIDKDGDYEVNMAYDAMIFVANWPSPRRQAWRTLLRARAIENLSYCVGVNRVGIDGNDKPYSGDSVVVDPVGVPQIELGACEQVVTTVLSSKKLQTHRVNFPAWMDADNFMLT